MYNKFLLTQYIFSLNGGHWQEWHFKRIDHLVNLLRSSRLIIIGGRLDYVPYILRLIVFFILNIDFFHNNGRLSFLLIDFFNHKVIASDRIRSTLNICIKLIEFFRWKVLLGSLTIRTSLCFTVCRWLLINVIFVAIKFINFNRLFVQLNLVLFWRWSFIHFYTGLIWDSGNIHSLSDIILRKYFIVSNSETSKIFCLESNESAKPSIYRLTWFHHWILIQVNVL